MPAATTLSGKSFVTTLFAPTMTPSPIVTPGRIHTFLESHTLRPIVTGPLDTRGRSLGLVLSRLISEAPWALSVISTFEPVNKLSPIVILLIAVKWLLAPMVQWLPMMILAVLSSSLDGKDVSISPFAMSVLSPMEMFLPPFSAAMRQAMAVPLPI